MSSRTSSSKIILFLTLAVLLDTATLLTWKSAVMRISLEGDAHHIALAILHEPRFYAVAMFFVLQFLNWMAVLSMVDVSYAQPVTSASYVTVAVLSALIFGEHITLTRGIGIALILAGVCFISTSPMRTTTSGDQ